MNPTKNPSALRSKKKITEALLLLMKQYPYTEITVKQILLETDISRKTFYRNFLSKDDVLNSFIDTIFQDYVIAIQQQKQKYSLIQTLDVIFFFCEKNKEILFILRDNRLLYLLLEKLNMLILNEHNRYISELQENHLESQLFTEYIIYFNIGGVWNLIFRWIENDMCDSINDITGKGNIIYIATDDGLIKFDKSNNDLKHYNVEDGLLDEKVTDVLIDSKGYVWLGTPDGVNILNPKTNKYYFVQSTIS